MNDQSKPDLDESKAPLIEHLIELRQRLLWSVAALTVAFLISIFFADEIFGILVRPLTDAFPAGEGKLIYTKLYEAFFVEIKVAMFAAFFLAFPIISNQLWAFVAPGLYAKEKKAFLPFLIATPLLFMAGASLAYFVVMPTAFKFFLGFEGPVGGLQQEALPAMGDYLSLVMQFILAFGVCFQLPVLLLLLNRAGIVPRQQVEGHPPLYDRRRLCSRRDPHPGGRSVAVDVRYPVILVYEVPRVVLWLTGRRTPR